MTETILAQAPSAPTPAGRRRTARTTVTVPGASRREPVYPGVVSEPTVDVHPAGADLRGVAVLCHGGTESSVEPPRERALSLLRMQAIEQYLRAAAGKRGIETQMLRYRVAGWNGSAADAYVDVRWAVERIREQHGAEVPVVLVGHSMGGRAALRAGGEPGVVAVCALAPWTPPGEPVEHLRGRTVTILHGRGDRWVPAVQSADFALRARRAGVDVARFTIAGGHSMLRRALRWHRFALDVVLGATGVEPMPAEIANALQRPVPDGLAVPL
jgi:dienelactone hydrolase